MAGLGILEGVDRPISLAQVAAGLQVSPKTVYSWMRHGVLPRGGGERVRLQVTKIGGRFYASPAKLRAFLEALNAEPARTDAEREADYVAAAAELESAGY